MIENVNVKKCRKATRTSIKNDERHEYRMFQNGKISKRQNYHSTFFFYFAFCYFCYSTFFSTFCTHSVVFGFIRSFCKFKIIFLSKETILQDVKWNELLSCKLRFSRYCRPYIFQSMISVRSNNLSLKYQRFTPPGCKDYRD